jgi:hypothetical protein
MISLYLILVFTRHATGPRHAAGPYSESIYDICFLGLVLRLLLQNKSPDTKYFLNVSLRWFFPIVLLNQYILFSVQSYITSQNKGLGYYCWMRFRTVWLCQSSLNIFKKKDLIMAYFKPKLVA